MLIFPQWQSCGLEEDQLLLWDAKLRFREMIDSFLLFLWEAGLERTKLSWKIGSQTALCLVVLWTFAVWLHLVLEWAAPLTLINHTSSIGMYSVSQIFLIFSTISKHRSRMLGAGLRMRRCFPIRTAWEWSSWVIFWWSPDSTPVHYSLSLSLSFWGWG